MSLDHHRRIQNISELKFNLKCVIENINLLSNDTESVDAQTIKKQTEAILNNLERQPQVIKSIISKRRRQRTKHKLRTINNKNKKTKIPNSKLTERFHSFHRSTPSFANQYVTVKIRTVHDDVKRYLEIFNLLENLYELRNNSCARFVEKLEPLRSTWKQIMRANTIPFQSAEEKIAYEWNEVIFGMDYEASDVKSKKIAVKELFSNRRIWDTYLTERKNLGSNIPIGWVLPKDENEKWMKYRKNV